MSPSPARIRSTIASVVESPTTCASCGRSTRCWPTRTGCGSSAASSDGPATVTELIDHVGLSQPLVSWHLSKLREIGLVSARRNGRETVHTIVPEAFDAVRGAPVAGPRPGPACTIGAVAT